MPVAVKLSALAVALALCLGCSAIRGSQLVRRRGRRPRDSVKPGLPMIPLLPVPIHRGPLVGDFDVFRASAANLIMEIESLPLRIAPPPHLPVFVLPPDRPWVVPNSIKVTVVTEEEIWIDYDLHN